MSLFMSLLVSFVVAFLAVLFVTPIAKSLALSFGFVDEPGGRKDHEVPVPPIGGLILFPVYMLTALFMGVEMADYWSLFCALGLILVVGALDDYAHISPWPKFIVQFIAAALVVIPGGAQLHHLGDLFGLGDFSLGFMTIPFSVVATVLLINAINLMDGLDGLAGGKSFVIFIWLVLACMLSDQWGALVPIAPLMGAMLGFLVYNIRHPLRGKASIFLGDAGSMGLGVVVAWFSIGLVQEPDPVLIPISIAWILALPIMDTCAQFYRRAREGRHPFSPDRGHFHHHLVHAGFPVGQSTALVLMIGLVLGAIGYGGVWFGVPQWILTVSWIALLFSHMALSSAPKTYIKFFNQFTDHEIESAVADKTAE